MINEQIIKIISTHSYYAEYQPIIETETQNIYAYEALARFSLDEMRLSPNETFALCHEDPDTLFLLESMVKKHQLNHRPKGYKLFINLDPDSFVTNKYKTFWIDLFSKQQDIVVEIIENSDDENIHDIEAFIDFLNEEFITYALDDFFQDNSLFSSKLFINAPIIKLDKVFLTRIRQTPAYKEFLRGIINFCHHNHKLVILEGVETAEDLHLAKELNVPYVQGFLFKERFICSSIELY